MHWIDILVIGTLLISGAFAYARGFVHEVLSIVAWVGAALATMYGTPALKNFTYQFIQDPFFAALVTGILIFIGTLIILSITTRRISRSVKDSALGALDRALGFIFGLLRGAIIVSLAWLLYAWFVPEDERPEWVYTARAMPMVIEGANILKSFVPVSYQDQNGQGPNGQTPNGATEGLSTKDRMQKLFNDAITPVPKAPARSKSDGYGKKERSEMDRLFDTSQ
ncbi:MAG: CvpA family protein [Magnetovibrio sp.]|nr:CvpA family protein [Magnetovibrio sp.]